MHIFTNYFKVLIRNKAVIFWTLLFPIILGGLFHFAFGNLANEECFKNIPVGLVESEGLKANTNFEQFLEDLSEKKDGEEPIFALNRYKDEYAAKAALDDGDIEGYFLLPDPADLDVAATQDTQLNTAATEDTQLNTAATEDTQLNTAATEDTPLNTATTEGAQSNTATGIDKDEEDTTSKPQVKIVVAKSGINQTIMKEVAEQYFQSFAIIGVLYDKGLIGVPQQGQPADPAQTGQTGVPDQTGQWTDPALAGQTEDPVQAGQPAVPAQAGQSADWAQTSQSVNPAPADEGVEAYMEVLNGETNFVDKSNDKVDSTVIYFYTLLAMVCMYGASFGISAVSEIQANLSRRASRMMVGPVSKFKALSQTVLAGFIILYAEVALVLFYLEKVLGVAFGDQRGYIFLLCFFGCFAGMGMGAFIGCSNRKSEDFKVGISILVTMTCCALGGMMYIDLRYIIKDNLPMLDTINPITMITDGLYSLYCYTDHALLWNSILRLSVFGVVFLALALWIMRGKRYDSI